MICNASVRAREKDREEFRRKTETKSRTEVVLLQEGETYQLN
jgi:hypothetical protein